MQNSTDYYTEIAKAIKEYTEMYEAPPTSLEVNLADWESLCNAIRDGRVIPEPFVKKLPVTVNDRVVSGTFKLTRDAIGRGSDTTYQVH